LVAMLMISGKFGYQRTPMSVKWLPGADHG
jgi:hypothetical protein